MTVFGHNLDHLTVLSSVITSKCNQTQSLCRCTVEEPNKSFKNLPWNGSSLGSSYETVIIFIFLYANVLCYKGRVVYEWL